MSDPIKIMTGVLDFLELKMTDGFANLVRQIVYPKDPKLKYAEFPLPDVPRAPGKSWRFTVTIVPKRKRL